ncbi:MAG TPA: cell division protein FtsZ [Leptospiraceae bacterium]|nr:cell division protein FtsZ [Leptospiraceae bacterium]HMW05017.1 cell division protein FtsZ [Leptospiraceae bacterium]HMX31461.1 cell division protein FtsZ [Leptospiraceae bacterium]HMY33571.1 cell division protein FtsZ [Leptospiraceae bacterium]HMZ62570.1 cell division protein FtsZ [Leptospiraceae bacterium]
MLYMDEQRTSPVVIKVVGVGGGGMNAVSRMTNANFRGVEFIVMNTDEQVLSKSSVENRVQLGNKVTRGMGAGGDPEIGNKAAQEDKDRIASVLKGADMVFVTAGMGGGTGTGAAPVIAEIAKELKCLVVGVVTLPFGFEGRRRNDLAKNGLNMLRQNVDTLITIKNDSIFKVVDKKAPIDYAFRVIDDILLNAVKGISDIINHPGIINVDFADVKTIMKDTGDAIMGVGEGVGENRVAEAVEHAINNVLLEETSIAGASSLLINVTGGNDLTINDWNEVSQIITSQVDTNANIIIGLNEEEGLNEKIRVTVIATGFRARLPHTLTSLKRDATPVISQQQNTQPQKEQKEAQQQPLVRPKVVNMPDPHEYIEPTRSIKTPARVNSPYNYNEDYDIPAYLRRGNRD